MSPDASVEPLSTTIARAPAGMRSSTHGNARASSRHGNTMSRTALIVPTLRRTVAHNPYRPVTSGASVTRQSIRWRGGAGAGRRRRRDGRVRRGQVPGSRRPRDPARRRRHGRARGGQGARPRPRRPRPDAAPPARPRGLPPGAGRLAAPADHHAHRAGRARRPHRRPRAGRRRLRHQAVLAARAGAAGRIGAAPRVRAGTAARARRSAPGRSPSTRPRGGRPGTAASWR